MNTKLKQAIASSFQQTEQAIADFRENAEQSAKIESMALAMVAALLEGNKIMLAGNGGSACQAMHFAEELTGRYRQDRKALPALALTDASHMSCVGNDYGFDAVFSRALEAYARPGDCLLLLSTSGNSPNLIKALQAAKALDVKPFALLGRDGGKLQGGCDIEIIVPGATSDCIQNLHMIIVHLLIETIERQLFPENYR